MPSLSAKLLEKIARTLPVKSMFESDEPQLKEYIQKMLRSQPFDEPGKSVEELCTVELASIGGYNYYVLTPIDKPVRQTFVYIHGGGFIMDINQVQWIFAAEAAVAGSARVYVPVYPLAPEASCVNVFGFLTKLYEEVILGDAPEKLIFIGDSAGAAICLSLALYARENKLQQPAKLFMISPVFWLTNLTEEQETQVERIEERDPLLSTKSFPTIAKWWRGPLDESHYYVNPMAADLCGLGEIVVYTGTKDLLYVTCEAFRAKALAQGVDYEYYVYEDMIHCFLLFPTKEGREARRFLFAQLADSSGLSSPMEID